jgi:hypothetical protein
MTGHNHGFSIVKAPGMHCPRCGSKEISQVHRTLLELLFTALTPYRKWGCDPCGYHWLGKEAKEGQ